MSRLVAFGFWFYIKGFFYFFLKIILWWKMSSLKNINLFPQDILDSLLHFFPWVMGPQSDS